MKLLFATKNEYKFNLMKERLSCFKDIELVNPKMLDIDIDVIENGKTAEENAWLQSRGRTTHILAGGTLIRYFSVYSDAANYGIGIASTAVAFIIFGITSKIKKYKYFCWKWNGTILKYM